MNRHRKFIRRFLRASVALGALALAGCGTTRSTDSLRTATEQLLISDAIDRSVQAIDFEPLAGQSIYLDDSRLEEVVDRDYLVGTLRQHLLASGCILKDDRDQADFIVEARAGAVGTDRNDLLFGIPATNVPQILPVPGVPTAIPEVPLAKRCDQRGIAKISMFAYHRESGRPVWQSGMAARESSSNDVWLFGAGPFQYGSILKSSSQNPETGVANGKIDLRQQVLFASPAKLVAKFRRLPKPEAVAAADRPKLPAPKISRLSAADDQPLPPNLVEAAKKKALTPRLTARITAGELLRNSAPKTVELSLPPREIDPIALPQPRFDSL